MKKLVGKPLKLRNDMRERVHNYMKQEEAAFEKIETDQGEKSYA